MTAVRRDLLDATMRLDYAKELRGTALKEKKPAAPFDQQIKTFEARVADLRKREKALDTGPTANVIRDAGTWVNGDDPAWTVIDYRPGSYRDLPVFVRGNPARPVRWSRVGLWKCFRAMIREHSTAGAGGGNWPMQSSRRRPGSRLGCS